MLKYHHFNLTVCFKENPEVTEKEEETKTGKNLALLPDILFMNMITYCQKRVLSK